MDQLIGSDGRPESCLKRKGHQYTRTGATGCRWYALFRWLRGIPPMHSLACRDLYRYQSGSNVMVMPTFHPSYLLRVPKAKREVWTDMQAVMQRLGLERS